MRSHNDIIIIWEAEDGYVGKSRPQETRIPRRDWDDCETQAEKDALIEEYVEEDFRNKISWYVKEIKE